MAGGGRDIRAGGAFVELYLAKKAQFQKDLKGIKTMIGDFAGGVRMAGTALTAIGGGALTGLGGAVASFVSHGDELTDTAGRLGINTDRLQELSFAASQSGASMDDVQRAMLMAQKKGLDFDKVAAKIGAIEDPVLRNRAAFEAFGKSGAKIAPMLADLAAQSQRAHDLGIVIPAEDVATAGRLADAFSAIKQQGTSLAAAIGAALAPAIETAITPISKAMTLAIEWIRNNKAVVVTVAAVSAGILAAGLVLLGFAGVLSIVSAAITGLSVIVGLASAVFGALLTPVGLLIAAIVALGAVIAAAIVYFLGWTEAGNKLVSGVMRTMKAIYNAIRAGNLELAWEIVWVSILAKFESFKANFLREWERLIEALPKAMGFEVDLGLSRQSEVIAAMLEAKRQELLAKAEGLPEPELQLQTPKLPPGAFSSPGTQSGTNGAFSAAAAVLLGRSGQLTVEEKMLDVLEDSDEKLAGILKKAEEGGLVFG